MKGIKLAIFYPLILLWGVSCGDSPFLKDSKETPQVERSVQGLQTEIKFPAKSYNVSRFWRRGPLVVDESRMLVVITDSTGRPISPDEALEAKIWMPTMGHGSFPISVEEVAPGVYELKDVFFTMEGYWDFHLMLVGADGQTVDEVKWGLNL
jgi:hypothetical protein